MRSVSSPVLIGILLSILQFSSSSPVLGQIAFNRNDDFDFTGLHYLRVFGTSPDDFNVALDSDSDFRRFKLHVRNHFNLGSHWIAAKFRVDMNNDGVWEQDWTNTSEMTISYYYPNPPDGISANHTMKVEFIFYYWMTHQYSEPRTKYHQIRVFSTPRVYVNSENDSFIQLRDEDCSAKVPVLMVEGFDPPNEKFPELYYNLTWDLINSDLYPNGYEVFILNFHNGGRDLRLNADVLSKAIEKIHEICPNYKIAVAGLSMGGPITRYALAKTEGQGGTHNVGLFLSYDSPQHWAHVSPSLQDWIASRNPDEGAIGAMQGSLQSIGAKQMLGYNTYDPAHILRDEFYGELNALNGDGYPHQSYNVSVSNGNLNATWGNTSIGRHLLTLKINDELIHDVAAVEFDCETGSMITDITMRRYGDIFHAPVLPHLYYEMDIIFNPAYTPTWSALDLVDWHDDPFGNITSFERSKFDDYVMQSVPLQHHELSTVTRSKIMSWLNKEIDISVNYNLLEGGSASPDNHPVNILHGMPITVQPKSININGKEITYSFLRWEDGDISNPRTFYSSHDISYGATMKGHLLTSDIAATANNNQQGIARTPDGKYHLVYESLGEIWYAKSVDGTSWSPEYRVSDGAGQNMNPSMSVSRENDQTYVRIVWANSSGSGAVLYREWTSVPPGPAESWGAIETVPLTSPSGHAPQTWTPVVGPYGWVVFNRYHNSGANGGIRAFHRDYSGVWRQTAMPATTHMAKLPSIISDASNCWVVCEESGAIRYNKAQRNGDTFTWSTTSDISTGSGRTANGSPSIAWADQNEGAFYTAWHGWSAASNQNEIVVRKYAGSWNSEFKTFGSCTPPMSFSNPVIRGLGSDNQYGLDNMLVTWRASDNTLYSARYLGQSQTWIVNQLGVSSAQPATLAGNTDGAKGRIAFVSSASLPYTINFIELSPPPAQVFSPGWNMAGVSLLVPNYSKAAVYPTAISPAYKYLNGSYVATDPLSSNYGWWIKFGSAQPALGYTGTRIDSMAMPVSPGWNIISSISVPVDTSTVASTPPGIRSSQFFKYQNGYVLTDKLHPGLGYWVKSNQTGYLHLKNAAMCPSGGGSGSTPPKDKFIITDAEGNQQELFVENSEVVEGTEDVEMPPAFDEAGFDVRWGSGDIGLAVDPDNGPIELPIDVNQAAFPVTLTWELDPENELDYVLIPPDGGGLGKAAAISSRGGLRVENTVNRILLQGKGRHHSWPLSLPAEYVLEPNYPNPFNPSTQMRYGVKQDGFVSLRIFDVLGREVKTLVQGNQSAGYHLATWDGTNTSHTRLSSGLYFARLTVTNQLGRVVYTNTNKLVMAK